MEVIFFIAIALFGALFVKFDEGGFKSSSSEYTHTPKEEKNLLRDSLTNEELKSLAKYNQLLKASLNIL